MKLCVGPPLSMAALAQGIVAECRQNEKALLAIQLITGASPARIREVVATKPYNLDMLCRLVTVGDRAVIEELRSQES